MSNNALLLQRYEKVRRITQTRNKSIELYLNRNTGQYAIVKMQQASIVKDSKVRNVLHQASFTQTMQGYRGVPFMIWSGKTKQQKVVLLVEQLGVSISQRLAMCNGKFSIKTVCMLGIEIIQIIKNVHDKGFVVSNVSLQLFQFGKGEKCFDLYINDLSECMVYKDFKTMFHILQPKQYYRSPANIFQSSAVFQNHQKSRRDDIQSVILILIYLLKGQLPWSKSFKKQIGYKPVSHSFMNLFKDSNLICQGIPKPFLHLLQDCRMLQFQQQPAYHWYILKLKSVLYTTGEQYDFVYDWVASQKFIKSLSVPQPIPLLSTENDDKFMSYLQQFVFPSIDIDEIGTKQHSKFLTIKQKNQQGNFDPYRNRPNISADGNKLISRKVKEDKGIKQEDDKINNSMLERKKKKNKECALM